MRIGALNYSPYIYNTNYVSAESMNRISAIDDDLVTSGTDYSSLVDDSLNENPLRRGETANFADVLSMQFQMSQLNASRLIKPAEEAEAAAAQDSRRDQYMSVQEVAAPEPAQETEATIDLQQDMMTDGAEEMQQISPATEAVNMQMDRNLYMMQKASDAYRVNMIA